MVALCSYVSSSAKREIRAHIRAAELHRADCESEAVDCIFDGPPVLHGDDHRLPGNHVWCFFFVFSVLIKTKITLFAFVFRIYLITCLLSLYCCNSVCWEIFSLLCVIVWSCNRKQCRTFYWHLPLQVCSIAITSILRSPSCWCSGIQRLVCRFYADDKR